MDRIGHPDIEAFKRRTYRSSFKGRTILEWKQLLSRGGEAAVALTLADTFGIHDSNDESVVE